MTATTTQEGTMNESMMNESLRAYEAMIEERTAMIRNTIAEAVAKAVEELGEDDEIGIKYITNGGGVNTRGEVVRTVSAGFREGIGINIEIAEAYRPRVLIDYGAFRSYCRMTMRQLGSEADDTWAVEIKRSNRTPESFTTHAERAREIVAQFRGDGAEVREHAGGRIVEAWFKS